MQKKRSRKNGTASADGPAIAGRRVRVRRRLVIGVAVAGLTVLVAGAPAVVSATRELNDSQRLVTLAEQTRAALTLAHLIGDERDAVIEYVAKGRPASGKSAVRERTARTDRQLDEVRAEADEDLSVALGRIGAVRAEALDGKGGALAAHQAYAGVIADLMAPGDRLVELTPPRAEAALVTTRPLAPLGQAVEQAGATRGLLLAALAVPRSEQAVSLAPVDELTVAAQRSRVREQAALDDFSRTARPDVRETLAATVTGPEVKTAEEYLKRLTDRPTLNSTDRKVDRAAVGAALTARVDRMQSVEATLASRRATALATLRDDDVTRLELLIAFVGVLFLFVVGFSTAVARSLTRPLSVLRRGAQRLATPEGSVEPVRFTGRNDEFAEVVRHLNAVRDQTVSLHTRIAGLDADRRRLIGRNEALTSGREALDAELRQLRAGLEEHRRVMSTTSVSLSLRTLGLVERQLAVIEELESKEQDPDRLATLFKLDHLATVMRRHNENLLVLAGQEHGHGQAQPVPLVDVMRAAVSEIERYERVDLAAMPSYTQVAGHAADDISHVLAELLENATTFSPPDVKVKVSGRLLDTGEVVLSVLDEGIGVTEDRMAALNARLATPEAYDEEPESEHGLGLGLYVAGRLAARHGVTAELRAPRHGGTEALVVVPATLLPTTPPVSPVHSLTTPGASALRLPGAIAEANENTLMSQRTPPAADPVVEAAAEPVFEPAAEPVGDPGIAADLAAAFGDPVPATPTPADAAMDAESGTGTEPASDLASDLASDPLTDPEAEPLAETEAAFDAAFEAEFEAEFEARTDSEPLPPADRVFTVSAREPEEPSSAEAPAEPAASDAPDATSDPGDAAADDAADDAAEEVADEVADVIDAPAAVPDPQPVLSADEELLARVVSEADAEAFVAPDAQAPPAEQVFTVPAPAAEAPEDAEPAQGLPRRIRPDAEPGLPVRPFAAAASDPHRRAEAEEHWLPRQAGHPEDVLTDKGLPKRTPRNVATGGRPADARPEPRRVDADELRRRLGGFYQGTQDGRRVVEAELAQDRGQDRGQTDQGDTAQEART
ncbi:nitrate- and nitrite sensing domain-containing protein [Streptomyces sp. NBC_01426]|uniref:sensor histidine kinase n=1 Tax=Streptomyces sp. NBC_01426 TaxID=2975866 RepID=UPI002E32A03E|nr:nitrate- and nitrite sensing domain-containing protein [Streptomyces sp. NBC_01426]